METFKERLDNLLNSGMTDVVDICDELGISKNELFQELTDIEGRYSTAGISTDYGTITKDD